ncbi:zinc finger CCCH domain-containing protein 18-like [Senna tora]|uniref:Zinc finger CCCH domain-containing protein 18-like n=1 Tax=Senna tora TaxID=362788 RepID=A0A834T5A8_9FABA|nr:zinc finger CCCH domain-containing protein 18-like [Senna tora]
MLVIDVLGAASYRVYNVLGGTQYSRTVYNATWALRWYCDGTDYTRIVFDKLQQFEAEDAARIVGYLLMQGHGEQEMAKLASYPDHLIRELAFNTKMELERFSKSPMFSQGLPPMNTPPQGLSHLPVLSSRSPTSPASFSAPSPLWEPHATTNNANTDFMPMGFLDSFQEIQKQNALFSMENHIDSVHAGTPRIASDYYSLGASVGNLNGKAGRRFSSMSEFPVKTCHYFSKGFCKHGSNCRYYHGQVVSERFSQAYGSDSANDDQVVSPGSLAQLESEIVDLLKLRRGNPITIASLPMAYYDKYKKVLQAEGYLTESQRHGKSGYSLTKLLARLKNSIRLIDRPHGQHAVVLAEDAPKYLEKGDPGQNISASRQIYLTFPADSTFTEEDVINYFRIFGTVEDVRIPSQQRRMFGFVTFVDPETVKTILDKSNPHFVRGSRVLVKPYREKAKLIDRKYPDRLEPPVFYPPQYLDLDSELSPMSRSCGNPRFPRRQLYEDQEQALEYQMRRLAGLQVAQQTLSDSPYPGFSLDVPKAAEDPFNYQPADSLKYAVDDKPSNQELDLPESPFACLIDTGIQNLVIHHLCYNGETVDVWLPSSLCYLWVLPTLWMAPMQCEECISYMKFTYEMTEETGRSKQFLRKADDFQDV